MIEAVQTSTGPVRTDAAAREIPAQAQVQPAAATPPADWGAIAAGTAVSCAVVFVMAFFSAGIGLSLSSAYSGENPLQHYLALALWLLWVSVSSFALGGYVSGRLRARSLVADPEEAEMRDGMHGLSAWGAAMVILAFASASSLYHIGKIGADLVSQAGSGGEAVNPADYQASSLLRGDGTASTAAIQAPAHRGGAAPAQGPGGFASGQTAVGLDAASRETVRDAFRKAFATGEMTPADRSYVVNVISAQTGIGAQEAARRVDAATQELKSDHDKTKQLEEKARKIGVLLSFISAAAMLIGAGAAFGGAALGGRHRDDGLHLRRVLSWRL
ncbi:hypothetical protein [Methylocystis heyeri]|uniref:Mll5186 protein n=1 Tax=Methylocystis heyeri TaxID=391905 RepID=A0A6B8KDR3_9HYPH|nr:hypothetical protein [Methylocystis heyeri]QGM45817.1 hypothetical protein H2LOC_008945 [Methylocystis heyeri]